METSNGEQTAADHHEIKVKTPPKAAGDHKRRQVTKACQTSESYFKNPNTKNISSDATANPFQMFTMPDLPQSAMGNVLMGKMMEDFESRINEQMKVLDGMLKQREEEEKVRERSRLANHIPRELDDSAKQPEKVWERLFAILEECRKDDPAIKDPRIVSPSNTFDSPLKLPQPHSETLVLQVLSSWISSWQPYHSDRISKTLTAQVCSWIRSAWRLQRPLTAANQDGSTKKQSSKTGSAPQDAPLTRVHDPLESVVHMHPWQGLVFACRVAMATRYGGWQRLRTEGFQALFSKPPIIYISGASSSELEEYLAMQLALSLNSIYRVPLARPFDADESVDLIALEQKVNADIAAGKTPLLIFAYAGSPICGTVDNVRTLHELCEKHRIWLHIEGVKLNDLVLLGVPTAINQVNNYVDSATLAVGQWLALPNMPFSTHILRPDTMKEMDESATSMTWSLSTDHHRIAMLPLWFRLQNWGHDHILERVKIIHEIMQQMQSVVEELPSLAVVNKHKVKDGETKCPNADEKVSGIMPTVRIVVTSLITMLTTWDTPSPILIFKFIRNRETLHRDPSREVAPYAANRPQRKTIHIQKPSFVSDRMTPKDRYMQALNSWLFKTLSNEFPEFNFRLVKLPGHRRCIRFCALEAGSACDVAMVKALIPNLQKSLQMYLRVLDATLEERLEFRASVQAREDLLFLDDPNYPGLGQLVYLPKGCHGRKSLDSLTDKELKEVSAINQYIVQEHLLHDKAPKVEGLDLNVFFLMEWNLNNVIANEEITPLDCTDLDPFIPPEISSFAFSGSLPQCPLPDGAGGLVHPVGESDSPQDAAGVLHSPKTDSESQAHRSPSLSESVIVHNAPPASATPPLETVFCIGFGLISPGTDVNDLLRQVTEAGRKVEHERVDFMRLENLVKEGIMTATKELSKEQKNKIMQMGMLRQVPYLDSLIGWWSPIQAQESSKGLTFDLARGAIASTEDTYKYKIQLQTSIPTDTSNV